MTLGKTCGSVWRGGGGRAAGADETAATVADLRTLVDDFVASAAALYRHDWREGDVVLVDNLATAHLAPPETQNHQTRLACACSTASSLRAPPRSRRFSLLI